ncbi:MAG TPA: phosphoribosyltransferase family protein [Pyrinomonadaceae bacterium]|nr:phosphoribosyltransferase family protein [Pyrinomonadaceae bacterium]
MTSDFIKSLPARRGHFLLESGYHTDFWFTLDALFVDPGKIAKQVSSLAEMLRPYKISAVCGPLLGGAFLAYAVASHMGLRFYYTQPDQSIDTTSEDELFAARYRLPTELRRQISNERVAIVDDFISAGSSVRATASELIAAGATTAVVGTMMLLGNQAVEYFSERAVPVVSVRKQEFNLWAPGECPLCRSGTPLENPVS